MKRVTRWFRSLAARLRPATAAGAPVTVRRRRRRGRLPLLWEA